MKEQMITSDGCNEKQPGGVGAGRSGIERNGQSGRECFLSKVEGGGGVGRGGDVFRGENVSRVKTSKNCIQVTETGGVDGPRELPLFSFVENCGESRCEGTWRNYTIYLNQPQ